MDEYIKREDAKQAAGLIALMSVDRKVTCGEVRKIMEDIPPADVKPVVRGKWIIRNTFDDCVYARCDQCAITQIFYYGKPLTNFCPNCGADMRKEENNNGN